MSDRVKVKKWTARWVYENAHRHALTIEDQEDIVRAYCKRCRLSEAEQARLLAAIVTPVVHAEEWRQWSQRDIGRAAFWLYPSNEDRGDGMMFDRGVNRDALDDPVSWGYKKQEEIEELFALMEGVDAMPTVLTEEEQREEEERKERFRQHMAEMDAFLEELKAAYPDRGESGETT